MEKKELNFVGRIRHLSLCLLFLLGLALNMQAQVTIGENVEPQSYSILELISNGKGGLRLPRLTTQERDQISNDPTFVNLKKDLAKGLLIYNLDTNCEDLWNGEEWKSFCGSAGRSEFTILDCSQVQVNGTYYNNQSLVTSHYLTIPVSVTKQGTYQIKVVPDPANGYYFIASGEFLSTGIVEVIAHGQGTPINYTPAGEPGDNLAISLNGAELNCTGIPPVKINDTDIRPKFGIACNSVTVSGIIKKGIALDASNKITLRLNVQTGSKGAKWEAYTNEIDGIIFKGNGVLGETGAQEITLYGEGITQNTSPKDFTIYTNSESTNATCKATVIAVTSQKKIVEFAYNNGATYGLASGNDNFGGGPKQLLRDNLNYGDNPNSIIKYAGFSNINHAGSLPAATTLKNNYCTGTNAYDIIIIDYNETPNVDQRQVLVNYVNAGGVLIYLDQNIAANNASLIGDIFGETIPVPVAVGSNCNYVIKMNAAVNDEISNGAFGDVRNGQWGEDYNNTCALTKIPKGAIVYSYVTNAYSGNTTLSNGARVTMLRHPTKNFFWCGDSGLIDAPNNSGQNTDYTTCPFKLGSVQMQGITYPYYPIDKENYGNQAAASRLPVCNSTIFANLMAWALKMAEENGINSGQ